VYEFLLFFGDRRPEKLTSNLINFAYLELHNQKNYYDAVFNVIEKTMLYLDIGKFRSEFEQTCGEAYCSGRLA
jgi:hypothetical protein